MTFRLSTALLLVALGLGGFAMPRSSVHAQAADSLAADPADVESVDAILAALYDVISGPPGPRDWDRMRSLFAPGARLIPIAMSPQRAPSLRMWSVEDYITNAGPYLEQNGFFEREIARETETFGHLVHALSSYASFHNADDAEPFARGINSIQLFHDGARWYVVTVYWQQETPKLTMPPQYLPGGTDG